MSQHNGDHQSSEPAAEALTALALNQLRGEEQAAAEAQLAAGGEAAQREVRGIQSLAAALSAARTAEPLPKPSAELRKLVEQRLEMRAGSPPQTSLPAGRRAGRSRSGRCIVAVLDASHSNGSRVRVAADAGRQWAQAVSLGPSSKLMLVVEALRASRRT